MKVKAARDTTRDQATHEFFARFDPPARDGELCPAINELVSYAKGNQHENVSSHVDNCTHCSSLVGFLTSANPEVSLSRFLKMARREAVNNSYDRTAPLYKYAGAFFLNQPQRAYAAFIALVLLFALSWVFWGKLENRQRLTMVQDSSASFPEDTYKKTVLALASDLEDAKISTYDRDQLQERIKEINGNLSQLQGLNNGQRAELAELIHNYNAAVTSIHRWQDSPQTASPTLAKTNDSQKVDELYAAIDQAMTRTKSNKVYWDVNRSSPVSTAQQLDVVWLDDNKIVMADLLPNRPSDQQKAIQEGIKSFEDKNKMIVDLRASAQPTFASDPSFSYKPE